MAEPAVKILGVDVVKVVSDGLTGGITGVVSGAGKMLIGRALAAEGIYLGDQATAHQLELINEELQQISATISEVLADVEDLQKDLKVDTAALQSSISQTNLIDPLSAIEASMSTLCFLTKPSGGTCGNFSIFTSDQKRRKVVAKAETESGEEQLKNFANSIVSSTTGINKSMTQIKNSLLNTSSSVGTINTLANYAITKMDAGDTRITEWYRWLESAVAQYMLDLNNGMILMANAISYLYDDPDKTAKKAQDYIETEYIPNIVQPIMEQFTSSVERMVLSRYNPTLEQDEVSFLSDDELQSIFTRSQLFAWLSTNLEDKQAGVFVTNFIRSSQVSGDGSLELQPNQSYPASKGSVPEVSSHFDGSTGSLMDNWYKCVDFDDSAATKMRSFDDSDIRVAHYHWDFVGEPTVGSALDTSGFFSSFKVQYYDRATLEPVGEAAENSVMAALAAQAKHITKNLLFTSVSSLPDTGTKDPVPAWEKEGYVDPDKKTDHDNMMKDIKKSFSATSSSHSVKLEMNIKKDDGFLSGAGPCRYKAKLKRNVHYAGKSDKDIYLYTWAGYDGECQQLRQTHHDKYAGDVTDCIYPPTTLDLVLKLNYFPDISKNSDKKDTGGSSIVKKENLTSFHPDDPVVVKKGTNVSLKGNQYAELQFRVYITGERQGTASLMSYCDKKSFVKGHWHVYNLRLGWPQPTLNQ